MSFRFSHNYPIADKSATWVTGLAMVSTNTSLVFSRIAVSTFAKSVASTKVISMPKLFKVVQRWFYTHFAVSTTVDRLKHLWQISKSHSPSPLFHITFRFTSPLWSSSLHQIWCLLTFLALCRSLLFLLRRSCRTFSCRLLQRLVDSPVFQFPVFVIL